MKHYIHGRAILRMAMFAACGALAAPVLGQAQWIRRLAPPSGTGIAASQSVVDAAGDIYEVGSVGNGQPTRVLVVKYSSAGAKLWSRAWTNGSTTGASGIACSLDGSGNLVAAAAASGSTPSTPYLELLKYSKDGTRIWLSSWQGPNSVAQAVAMATDTHSNVFVACEGADASGYPTYLVVKFSSAGKFLWSDRYHSPNNGFDVPSAITTDATGNCYVTGSSSGYAVTISYAPSGKYRWTSEIGRSSASSIALDSNGNVMVAGLDWSRLQRQEVMLIQLAAATGATQWRVGYHEPRGRAQAAVVCADHSGGSYVLGWATGADSSATNSTTDAENLMAAHYDSSGSATWIHFWAAGAGISAVPAAAAVDGSDNLLAVGYYSQFVTGVGGVYRPIALKYDSAGTRLWAHRYRSPYGSNYNVVFTEALFDPLGNPIVVGGLRDTNQVNQILTIKYMP